jgi:hypothetical protein
MPYSSSDYIGLFGYTNGSVIKNLKLENSTIKGKKYTGGIIGYTYLTNTYNLCVNNLNVEGDNETGGVIGYKGYKSYSSYSIVKNTTVKGVDRVGGFVGNNYGTGITNVIVDADVEGNSNVGGVAGYNYGRDSYLYGVMIGGTVTSNTTANRIVGAKNYGSLKLIGLNTILVNGIVVSSTSTSSLSGKDVTSEELQDINTYTQVSFNIDNTTSYYWTIVDNEMIIKTN